MNSDGKQVSVSAWSQTTKETTQETQIEEIRHDNNRSSSCSAFGGFICR